MITIKDEIEINKIKTEKKIVKNAEVEYLTFHLQGKYISIAIKDELLNHPLLSLQSNGLKVKAQIVLRITDSQTTIENFKLEA